MYTPAGRPLEGGGTATELRSLAAVPGTVTATGAVPGTLAETVLVPRAFMGPSAPDPLPDGTLAGASPGLVHWLDPSGAPIAGARFEGRVVAGGGAIWAVGGGVARRLVEPGGWVSPWSYLGWTRAPWRASGCGGRPRATTCCAAAPRRSSSGGASAAR
ncbi:hypothetical protein ACFQ0B_58560 [Nonomuraea thailandensis]